MQTQGVAGARELPLFPEEASNPEVRWVALGGAPESHVCRGVQTRAAQGQTGAPGAPSWRESRAPEQGQPRSLARSGRPHPPLPRPHVPGVDKSPLFRKPSTYRLQ